MPVNYVKKLRQTELNRSARYSTITMVFRVSFDGVMDEDSILLGSETGGVGPDPAPHDPVPLAGSQVAGISVVTRVVRKRSAGIATIRVVATNAPYYGGTLPDFSPRAGTIDGEITLMVPVYQNLNSGWILKRRPYPRGFTSRVYEAVTGYADIDQLIRITEDNKRKIFKFTPDNRRFLLARAGVSRYYGAHLIRLVFTSTAAVPAWPSSSSLWLNDVSIPALGPMDEYTEQDASLSASGAQITAPSVGFIFSEELFAVNPPGNNPFTPFVPGVPIA